MARPINPDPEIPGEGGEPGDPGYVPPTDPSAKIAVVVTGTSYTFTADQIAQAGGPFASYSVRVTPVNDNGSGPSQTVTP